MKKIIGLFVILAILLAGGVANAATQKDLALTKLKVNDNELKAESDTVSLDRGKEVDISVYLTANKDLQDVELKAFISGYEYSDVEEISDSTGTFDVKKGISYVKNLEFKIPEEAKEGDYKLRIMLSDKNSLSEIHNYKIKIEAQRHKMTIKDIMTQNTAKAGSSLLATVRLENLGGKDEENIKVVFSIPQLGLQTTEYIEEIENDDEAETEEMYLKLPRCAAPGTYTAEIEATYKNGRESISTTTQIEITENEACNKEKTVIVVQEPTTTTQAPAQETATKSKIRTGLEIILIVLVGLLILIGIVIGLSRMRKEE